MLSQKHGNNNRHFRRNFCLPGYHSFNTANNSLERSVITEFFEFSRKVTRFEAKLRQSFNEFLPSLFRGPTGNKPQNIILFAIHRATPCLEQVCTIGVPKMETISVSSAL